MKSSDYFKTKTYVFVKLTDMGLAVLEEKYNKLKSEYSSLHDLKKPSVNNKGYSKFEVNELRYYLNDYVISGSDVLFDPEVIVEHCKVVL